MTVALLVFVLLLLAGMWAVCESLHHLGERDNRLADRVASLEAHSRAVNNRIDLLQMELDNINGLDDDDKPFEPDTDMED